MTNAPLDLADIRALAEASTPVAGYCVWDASSIDDLMTSFRACVEGGEGWRPWMVVDGSNPALMTALTGNGPTSKANAQFYASARDIVIGLCDLLEEIRRRVEQPPIESH